MDIRHDEANGEFYHEQDGERIALLSYKRGDGEINITHTEVSDKLSGQGVGKKLVAEAVKFARENDLKVIATCPFAAKLMLKTPEFQDVIK